MATIRCPNGHEVSDEGKFCSVCGVRTREEPLATVDQPGAPASMPLSPVSPPAFPSPVPDRSMRARWSSLRLRTKIGLIVGAVFVGLVLVGALLPDSNSPSGAKSAAPTGTTTSATEVKSVTDTDGWSCDADTTKYGLCPLNPYFGKKPAAARRERHQAAATAARINAARRAQEAAAARAEAARIAAANAWHKGYNQQDENVYWKWVNSGSCQDFVQDGCWHVAVITRDGCSSYVGVNANEYQGGSIVGQLLDNQGYGIPAKTPRVFELDADSGGVKAGDVSIDCT